MISTGTNHVDGRNSFIASATELTCCESLHGLVSSFLVETTLQAAHGSLCIISFSFIQTVWNVEACMFVRSRSTLLTHTRT